MNSRIDMYSWKYNRDKTDGNLKSKIVFILADSQNIPQKLNEWKVQSMRHGYISGNAKNKDGGHGKLLNNN